MVMTSVLAAGLTAASMWMVDPVVADAAPVPQEAPAKVQPKVMTGSVDAGVYAGRQPDEDVVVVSPLLQLGVRARPEVELGLSMGVVSLSANRRDTGPARVAAPSNFVFGTRWIRDGIGDRHHGYLGFAFSLPTSFEVGADVREANRYARASRGGLDPWQWSPTTLGVVLPVGWSMRGRWFDVGADGALGGLFSAGGDLDDPGFVGQIRGTAAVHIARLRLGGALAAVYNGRDELGSLQTSVNPFAEVPLCARENLAVCGVHVHAGASVNLDAPYGFGPEGMRVWGMQFGLRWALRDVADGL